MVRIGVRIGLLAFVGSLALSGCMVGPDYERPETAADGDIAFVNAPSSWKDADAGESGGAWWESFGDPVVSELVETALANNTSLWSAAAAVDESRALLAQSHGVRLPDVSYLGLRGRAKSSFNSPAGRLSFISQTYSQELSISYIADIFGKLRRAEQGAVADLLATEAAREALTHSVIAQVVRGRTRIATLERLIEIALADIESRKDTLEIVERRYGRGLVSSLDVHLARENLAAAAAFEPQLRQSLQLARHGLDVLLGMRAGASANLPDTLGDLPDLSPVPVGLPAGLLDRRPDVRAAEFQLVAATERVGVSVAEMFPDFTLTGSGGYRSGKFATLMDPESEIWAGVIGLAAPVFKGGRLKAGVEAARARSERARAAYAGVVLEALREVEDALVRCEMLSWRMKELEVRLREARSAEELADDRYSKGLERILIVLETERRRRLAENELVSTKGQLFGGRIDLFLALGGDWGVGDEDVAVTGEVVVDPEGIAAAADENSYVNLE